MHGPGSHAPTRFLVARYLLSKGAGKTSQIAEALHLSRGSTHRVLRELEDETHFDAKLLVDALLHAPRRPHWTNTYYRAPNPRQWQRAFQGPSGLSGEMAAEVADGIDLVSDKCIIYVPENSLYKAIHASERIKAKIATPSKANLIIRKADPWLEFEEGLVERGQRFYDYATSKHIHLRQWRPPRDLLSK